MTSSSSSSTGAARPNSEPLIISQPLYSWPGASTGSIQRVTYDRYWNRVIHLPNTFLDGLEMEDENKDKCFYVVDVSSDEESTEIMTNISDRVSRVMLPKGGQLSKLDLYDVKFAPDDYHFVCVSGKHELYLGNRDSGKCGDWNLHIPINLKWQQDANYEILHVLWNKYDLDIIKNSDSSCIQNNEVHSFSGPKINIEKNNNIDKKKHHVELIVVSTCGIEILKFFHEAGALLQQSMFEQCAKFNDKILEQGEAEARALIRTGKNYQISCKKAWVDSISHLMVLLTHKNTLQPFDLRTKTPHKLPKFDLYVGKSDNNNNKLTVDHFDVNVITLYNETYCVHLDTVHGRVSLRNITNPNLSKPQHDIVLAIINKKNDGANSSSLKELHENSPRGPLRLSTVDNLLLVHRIDRALTWVFDIHQKKPAPLGIFPSFDPNYCGEGLFDYMPNSDVLLDKSEGKIYVIKVTMDTLLLSFKEKMMTTMKTTRSKNNRKFARIVKRNMEYINEKDVEFCDYVKATNAKNVEAYYNISRESMMMKNDSIFRKDNEQQEEVLEVLLRRKNCRTLIADLFSSLMDEACSLNTFQNLFRILNQSYRKTIEELNAGSRSTTISMQVLMQRISDRSVLSERDMVFDVFIPYLKNVYGSSVEIKNYSRSSNLDFSQTVIPRVMNVHATNKDKDHLFSKSSYILQVVTHYLHSLLNIQIMPHKILQCFLFDLALFFKNLPFLQQLVHYNLMYPGAEICKRLYAVFLQIMADEEEKRRHEKWLTQTTIDMAWRLAEHDIVADILLQTGNHIEVVLYCKGTNLTSYPLLKVFDAIESSSSKQLQNKNKEERLKNACLDEIASWIEHLITEYAEEDESYGTSQGSADKEKNNNQQDRMEVYERLKSAGYGFPNVAGLKVYGLVYDF